ncbi:MAG: hypothetical protein LUQ07_05755 [Methanospirillum sp.]|nr:hypothetical protein [Methanospirillum sp.]
MILHPDDTQLEALSRFIAEHTGISFPESRFPDLARCLSAACYTLRIPDPGFCLALLDDPASRKKVLDALVSHITVGETYFFRDRHLFSYLRDEYLHRIVRERRNEGRLYLRIWCAACSSGEEPYSVAILLIYLLADITDWDIYLLGTDINQEKLDRAIIGEYSRWSFREEPIVPVSRYFVPVADNRVKIDLKIKNMVKFKRLNLVGDTMFCDFAYPVSLDLILCRNVLMYFSSENAEKVVASLVKSLIPGGFLFVSPQEISIVSHPGIRMEQHGTVFLHVKGDIHTDPLPGRNSLPYSEPADEQPGPESPDDEYIPPGQNFSPVSGISGSYSDEEESPSPGPELVTEENQFEVLLSQDRPDDAGRYLLEQLHTRENIQGSIFSRQIEELLRTYAGKGEYSRALGWSDRMIAEEPLNPRAYLLKGAIFEEQQRNEDAIQSFRQSLYADPGYIPGHLAIAGIYAKIGKKDEARHHYTLAVEALSFLSDDTIVEETEGIPAGKMKVMIQMILRSTR